jgi:hypothetical protein
MSAAITFRRMRSEAIVAHPLVASAENGPICWFVRRIARARPHSASAAPI